MNGLEIYPEILSKESCEKLLNYLQMTQKKFEVEQVAVVANYRQIFVCEFDTKRWSEYSNLIMPGLKNLNHNVKQKYPFLVDGCHFWKPEHHYNIQHYKDGEGYYDLHNEHNYRHCHRMMAWMIT